jgi:hypothetical protein
MVFTVFNYFLFILTQCDKSFFEHLLSIDLAVSAQANQNFAHTEDGSVSDVNCLAKAFFYKWRQNLGYNELWVKDAQNRKSLGCKHSYCYITMLELFKSKVFKH